MFKTIDCGELRSDHEGQEVTLAGWVDRRRDHGNLIFIDLRDRSGIVQAVFNPDLHPEPHDLAGQVRSEWVVQVSGRVTQRSDETINPNLPTGEIEVAVESMTVLNESKTPPFYVNEESEVDELLRLKYRYLDLRRPKMRDMLVMRHRAVKFIRDFLSERGFLDIETPILIKSTPEGARDYLVPSRLYPGKFYALPQSPQQLKQLLMAAGVEKYFQIAKCFRDEDPRGDRQPEFTQLDLEMSFVDEDDVLDLIEDLYTALFETLVPERNILSKPFQRIPYAEAMEKYATDRPDLRYGLEMADLGETVKDTEFRVFQSVLSGGGIVKGFAAPGLADMPRRQLDDLVEFAKYAGAQGLVYIVLSGDAPSIDGLTDEHIKSPVAKFLSLDVMKEMARETGRTPATCSSSSPVPQNRPTSPSTRSGVRWPDASNSPTRTSWHSPSSWTSRSSIGTRTRPGGTPRTIRSRRPRPDTRTSSPTPALRSPVPTTSCATGWRSRAAASASTSGICRTRRSRFLATARRRPRRGSSSSSTPSSTARPRTAASRRASSGSSWSS